MSTTKMILLEDRELFQTKGEVRKFTTKIQ